MSRRRTNVCPPASANEPRWLVVEDQCRNVLEHARLEPGADLVAALVARRHQFIGEGWAAGEIDKWQCCYVTKDGDRRFLHLRAVEPGVSLVGHGTHLCGNAPGR